LDPRGWRLGAPYDGRFDDMNDLTWCSWVGTDPRPRIATGSTHNPGPWPTGPNLDGGFRLRLAETLDRLGLRSTATRLHTRGLLARWAHGDDDAERIRAEVYAYVDRLNITRTIGRRRVARRAQAALLTLYGNEDWW